jgi:hypothetical protein
MPRAAAQQYVALLTGTLEHALYLGHISIWFDSMQYVTPLHIAARQGNIKTAKSLLCSGADLNAQEVQVCPVFPGVHLLVIAALL